VALSRPGVAARRRERGGAQSEHGGGRPRLYGKIGTDFQDGIEKRN
jgi:hypothetical protein